MGSIRWWVSAFLCLKIAAAPEALADACTVTGVVLDKAMGQGLPGVEVFLINVDKNIPERTVTNEKGEYVFNLVYPPGLYKLRVMLQGYVTTEYKDLLSVRINDTTIPVPPISMERSASSSPTVSVEGRSAVVNSADATSKLVLDPLVVEKLPLSGTRTFDQLAVLAPGVFEVPASSGTGPGVGPGIGTAGQFSVNGQRGRNNNFLVDLSDNNDQDVGVRRQGYVSLIPQSIESIENYQVISGNYQAEFGRNSGSIVNAVSKSGGNAIHGTVYEYFTNNKLSARNFFDQEEGPAPGENPFRRHQYGFVVGGPFVKDKAFWFGSFEQQRIRDRPEKHFAVPILSERSFFGRSPLVYSPGNNTDSRGNRLDDLSQFFQEQRVALFGLAGRAVWSLVPMPNNPGGPYGSNTYTEQLNGDGDGTIFSFKVDHKFMEKNTFTARYNFTDDALIIPVTGGGIHSSVRPEVRTQNISLFLNSVLSLAIANQARFSFGRTNLEFLEVPGSPLLFGSRDQQELLNFITPEPVFEQILRTPIRTDFAATTYGPFGTTGALGQLLIRPFSPIGVDVFNVPQTRVNNTFQYADTFIQRIGSHTLRTGIDIRRGHQNSRLDRNLRPLADFSGALGTRITLLDGVVRGTDLASIGYATGFLQTLIPDFDEDGRPDFDTRIGLRFTEFNLFVQDDWKITPRVNLSFGARYEFNTAPTEVNRKIESTFLDLLAGIPRGTVLPAVAVFERDFDAVVTALNSIIDERSSIFDSEKKNWAPRFGFAWDPTGSGKSAIRGGYGLFYDQNISAVTSQSRNVFPHLIPVNSGGFGVDLQGLFLANPQYLTFNDLTRKIPVIRIGSINTIGTPASYFRGTIGLLNNVYGQGIAFTLPTRRLLTPYAQHYHVTVERQVVSNVMISLGYFGSRGIHLTRFRSPNGGISGSPNFDAVPSNTFPTFFDFTARTVPPARNDSRLGAYTIFENSASSSYNSLQLAAQGRLSQRLQFTSSYTWSHVLDDVSDVFDGLSFFARPQSERNFRAERGSANFDVRHRVSASYIWNLPWGGSRPLWRGWSLAGFFIGRTGQPFTINSAFDVNNDGVFTDRLNTTQGIQEVDQGPVQLVLPAGSVNDRVVLSLLARPGNDGLVGRNTFRAPGVASFDFSVLKEFRLSEQRTVELRSEFFNVFNRTHFGIPVRILEAPSFGRAVDTSVNPRVVQIALKFSF